MFCLRRVWLLLAVIFVAALCPVSGRADDTAYVLPSIEVTHLGTREGEHSTVSDSEYAVLKVVSFGSAKAITGLKYERGDKPGTTPTLRTSSSYLKLKDNGTVLEVCMSPLISHALHWWVRFDSGKAERFVEVVLVDRSAIVMPLVSVVRPAIQEDDVAVIKIISFGSAKSIPLFAYKESGSTVSTRMNISSSMLRDNRTVLEIPVTSSILNASNYRVIFEDELGFPLEVEVAIVDKQTPLVYEAAVSSLLDVTGNSVSLAAEAVPVALALAGVIYLLRRVTLYFRSVAK